MFKHCMSSTSDCMKILQRTTSLHCDITFGMPTRNSCVMGRIRPGTSSCIAKLLRSTLTNQLATTTIYPSAGGKRSTLTKNIHAFRVRKLIVPKETGATELRRMCSIDIGTTLNLLLFHFMRSLAIITTCIPLGSVLSPRESWRMWIARILFRGPAWYYIACCGAKCSDIDITSNTGSSCQAMKYQMCYFYKRCSRLQKLIFVSIHCK